MNNSKILIFVYNAESNWLNKATDFAHKLIKPITYQCDLCCLTHNAFHERKEWTVFIKSTGYKTEFYYKNKYDRSKGRYMPPFIVLKEGNNSQLLFSNSDLAKFNNLDEFIKAFKLKLGL